jgi:uncharacterized lipoprotein YmbA
MKSTTLFSLFLIMLLSGCVNLKPKPDRSQVFALASDVAAAADVEGKPECYVSRVELPGFLEGTRIYYRSAHGELDSVSSARWAESPVDALPRSIAMHLQATGQANVRAYYPWAKAAREATTIAVQFERFSANAEGQVEVVARWQIESAGGRLKDGRYIAPNLIWDGVDAADYVAKINQALAGLAQAIAQEL